MKDVIVIEDLEVHFRVGVPDEERSSPQRLLLSMRLMMDFSNAAESDDVDHTIDYDRLTREYVQWGSQREWKLIETLAVHTADWILQHFSPDHVEVSVKKFILPQTRYVGVSIQRSKAP